MAEPEPPTPPAGVSAQEGERLTALVAARCTRQRAELEQAGERAFHHIPRLLRGPVRKVVGG